MENEPDKLAKILGTQEVPEEEEEGKSSPYVKDDLSSTVNDDEDEPVVLNKSGKGTIPYQKHKELRVEKDLFE